MVGDFFSMGGGFVFSDLFFLQFFLLVTVALLFIGVFRKQYFFTLVSGIGFMMFGLFLFSGINYSVLSSENISNVSVPMGTIQKVDYFYQTVAWPTPYTPYVNWFFIFIGLLLILVTALDYFKSSENPDTEVEE